MLLLKKKIDTNITVFQVKEYNQVSLEEAETRFHEYQQQGVILNGSFHDDTWKLTNQKSVKTIEFELDEVAFAKEAKERNIGKYKDLISAIKAFVLFKLESNIIESIVAMVGNLKRLLLESSYLNESKLDLINRLHPQCFFIGMVDFLDFYDLNANEEYIELIIEKCEELYQSNLNKRRSIGDFESVFRFSEALDWYWEMADEHEKERFYPIKLWWEITTIIPLRTTEFLLIPYDCLRYENGLYYLKVRRSALKGKGENREVHHNVEEDYVVQELRINESLFNLINRYKDIVDVYDFQENFYDDTYDIVGQRNFLLSHRSYFKFLKQKSKSLRQSSFYDYFNRKNLSDLIECFFIEVLKGIFNYEIIQKDSIEKTILPYQIEMIAPMDTRHYAFSNLVLNDLEPLIIKEIAGHRHIDSSYHYFSHVGKFVKSLTYSMAKRLMYKERQKSAVDVINMNAYENADLAYRKVIKKEEIRYRDCNNSNGKCSFPKDGFERYEECRKHGFDCTNDCSFYHPINDKGENEILDKIKSNENLIDVEIQALQELIKKYKRSKNLHEEYGQIVNKIKGIANQNAFLISKYVMEDN